ncbi:MAG: hypothetical protein N3A54_04070 [Patescibacteria group bacterium]|nr:hypothetical protein [Patescibacteria group bacterium]
MKILYKRNKKFYIIKSTEQIPAESEIILVYDKYWGVRLAPITKEEIDFFHKEEKSKLLQRNYYFINQKECTFFPIVFMGTKPPKSKTNRVIPITRPLHLPNTTPPLVQFDRYFLGVFEKDRFLFNTALNKNVKKALRLKILNSLMIGVFGNLASPETGETTHEI